MPEYVYKCTTCNHEFECRQSIKEEPHTKCDIYCDLDEDYKNFMKGEVHRIPQRVGVSFKGPGFYVNDYTKREQKDKEFKQKVASPKASKIELPYDI